MDKELENSLGISTIVMAIIATITSTFIIYTSLYFEETNFHKSLSRLVAIDFAQINNQSVDKNQLLINAVDKYDLIAGERFDIHSSEVFSDNDSGNFIFATAGDRSFRFEIKPESSYFLNRVRNMALLSFVLSGILIFLVRIIFIKIVFKNILRSDKLLNKVLNNSYSDELTQQELIENALKLRKKERFSSQIKLTHNLLRRFASLPRSGSRKTVVR
jgi:hypothetical protein